MKKNKDCKSCIYSELQKDMSYFCRALPPVVLSTILENPITGQTSAGFASLFPQCPKDLYGCGLYNDGSDIIVLDSPSKVLHDKN